MSDSGTSDIETPEIEPRKISRNSNGHNFSQGGPIQALNILRRSKLNNGISREIKIVINLQTGVRFMRISNSSALYIETLEIELRKLSIN